MNEPFKQEIIDNILKRRDIADISKATIRQCVAVANEVEDVTGEAFVRLEMGVPGIKACQVGIEAQKRALDSGIASIYPNISGLAELKTNASQFLKAFLNVDIDAECVVPTVGSMQGCFNLLLECSQLNPEKDTILYINPGFPPHVKQAQVLGIKYEQFDIYDYRDERLREKLESYFEKGNIAAVLYSNPNNPTWVCLTDNELKILGECATKHDVVVLEDLAYLCMDFRDDKSHPFEPPYQPTIAHYTDNYVLMMSGSKMFSYAGERIALVAFSPKQFKREYPELRRRYGMGRMGDNYIFTFLYVASSGTSHSAQYALAAMMKAAVEGEYDFVKVLREYGARATISKEIFQRHGFHVVYDKDIERQIGDGFFYTIGYPGLSNHQLLNDLMRCGIAAITLNSTGSEQLGIRVCVSQLTTRMHMKMLDDRLAMFAKLQNDKKNVS